MSDDIPNYNCAICGKHVDPNYDILYKAGTKNLFPVHRDECAGLVKDTVTTARKILESRFPILKAARKFATAILKD